MKKKILNSLVYVVLPFWLMYLFIKNKEFNWKYSFLYLGMTWQCQKSKLQIKFGLCKTYTIDELKKELNVI